MSLVQAKVFPERYVLMLLGAYASCALAGTDPRQELFAAIDADDLDRVRLTLSANPRMVKDARNVAKWTPLYEVVFNGSENAVSVMTILLEHGADANALDSQKNTPLHIAGDRERELMADEVYLGIIDSLLANRADVSARNHVGVQPLHLWMLTGADVAAVERLLAAGADINSRASKQGWTPLHGAVGSGRLDLVNLLLQKGARLDLKDGAGLTPLEVARKVGQTEVEERLLQHGEIQ